MAQRAHPLNLQLGRNFFWDSVWFSKTNYPFLLHEDLELKSFFTTIFKRRLAFTNKVIMKRVSNCLFCNIYIYSHIRPNFRTHMIPSPYKQNAHLNKCKKIKDIKKLVKYFTGTRKVYFSIVNLFALNTRHSGMDWLRRTISTLMRYRKYRFFYDLIFIFRILVYVKAANLLTQSISLQLHNIEYTKNNRAIWQLISFLRRSIAAYKTPFLNGIRLHIKGRFNARRRTRRIKMGRGHVPLNTFKSYIDYSFSKAITKNGSYGIKVWVCYSF